MIEPVRPAKGFGDGGAVLEQHKAEAPRAPLLPTSLARVRATRLEQLHAREVDERRSMQRGLILLAVLVLAAGLWSAGLERVFPPGWLHRW